MAGPNDKKTHPEEERKAALQVTLWTQLQRFSRDLIYTNLMRSGGEPFGAPYEVGVPSLTERIVKRFKQRSFFSFTTMERLAGRGRAGRNRFTRHGAAPYRGAYRNLPEVRASRGVVGRFLQYLRDNRYFLFGGGEERRPGERR